MKCFKKMAVPSSYSSAPLSLFSSQPLLIPLELPPQLFTSVLFHNNLCFNRPVFISIYNDIKFYINNGVVLLHQSYVDFLWQ